MNYIKDNYIVKPVKWNMYIMKSSLKLKNFIVPVKKITIDGVYAKIKDLSKTDFFSDLLWWLFYQVLLYLNLISWSTIYLWYYNWTFLILFVQYIMWIIIMCCPLSNFSSYLVKYLSISKLMSSFTYPMILEK